MFRIRIVLLYFLHNVAHREVILIHCGESYNTGSSRRLLPVKYTLYQEKFKLSIDLW